MLANENNWAPPEPTPEPAPEPITEPIPKPTPKKRGVLFFSPEDMQEAKKSMKEKGIKAEDVKNLPPIEEIHGLNILPVEEPHCLDNPTQVVKISFLSRWRQCMLIEPKHPLQNLNLSRNLHWTLIVHHLSSGIRR